MPDLIVYGFPRSTFVNIVRLILAHKDVAYDFRDLEAVMGKPEHLALHPFNRVPILKHDDFVLYETSAIARYIDEAFEGPRLTPRDVRTRARMNQWISAVNSYYYLYMIYLNGWFSRSSALHPMKRWWRTPCPRSSSGLA
jgi:glutathione S-transferase